MNTTDRIINDVAIQFANKVIECANFKALYKEAQEQCKQVNDLLAKFNKVLESDPALKELFDEASTKIEEAKADGI